MRFESKEKALIACEAASIRFRVHCEASRDGKSTIFWDEDRHNAVFDLDAEADGSISASYTIKPQDCNHVGFLAGGLATALLDLMSSWNSIMFTRYDEKGGQWDVAAGASRTMNTSYLHPAMVGSTIRISSKPVVLNRTMMYFEGYIKSLDGKRVYTTGQHHIFGFPVRGDLEEKKKLLERSFNEAEKNVRARAKL